MQGAPLNYYQRHIGDYAAATRHLSILEHGVYTLLMDRYYSDECGLPADPLETARLIVARSKPEIAAVKLVLKDFFTLTDEGWKQTRCDNEIGEYRTFIDKQRANGRASAAKRKVNGGSTVVQPSLNGGSTRHTVPVQPPTPTPTPNSEDQGSSAATQPADPPGADPRKAIFDLGKRILGASSGGLISAAITRKGESYVAGVIGEMSMQSYADPKAYFQAATRVGHDRVVV